MMYPWLDRRGRFDTFRAAVFAGLLIPGLVLLGRIGIHDLGARPLTTLNHETGLWAIRLVVITLAITPLRLALKWQALFSLRRMIGVATFIYAAIHFGFYVADQEFDLVKIGGEIIHRFYLTIGAIALACLLALAATSTDGMMRRIGGLTWRRLHMLIYPLALLAAVHYFLQSKLNVDEPIVLTGLLIWLLGFRLFRPILGKPVPLAWRLAIFSIAATLVTWISEIAYYTLQRHIPVARIIMADLSAGRDLLGLRPIWWVLIITGMVTAATALRAHAAPVKAKKPQAAALKTS